MNITIVKSILAEIFPIVLIVIWNENMCWDSGGKIHSLEQFFDDKSHEFLCNPNKKRYEKFYDYFSVCFEQTEKWGFYYYEGNMMYSLFFKNKVDAALFKLLYLGID